MYGATFREERGRLTSIRVLAVSDQVDPRIYSASLKERMSDVRIVFGCGDLPASYLEFLADALDRPVYFVYGNHLEEATRQSGGKLYQPMGCIDIGGKVQARAIVDLDAVRKSQPRGYLDPMNLLFGSVEVAAAGTLQAANGKGTFQLASATLGALPIPKTLLQELITYYTKSPEMPNGFDLDKPFDLPANIRQVEIQRGSLTVVQ